MSWFLLWCGLPPPDKLQKRLFCKNEKNGTANPDKRVRCVVAEQSFWFLQKKSGQRRDRILDKIVESLPGKPRTREDSQSEHRSGQEIPGCTHIQ
jgi:hypothetical protein